MVNKVGVAERELQVQGLIRDLYDLDGSGNYSIESVKVTVGLVLKNPDVSKLRSYRDGVSYLLGKDGHQASSKELTGVMGSGPSVNATNFSPYYRGVWDKKGRVYFIPDENLQRARDYVRIMDRLIGVLSES